MFGGAAMAREIRKRPRLLKSCGISPLFPAAIGCPERNVSAVATPSTVGARTSRPPPMKRFMKTIGRSLSNI
jgi:hypothetical protein